jgi:hypothetical protein
VDRRKNGFRQSDVLCHTWCLYKSSASFLGLPVRNLCLATKDADSCGRFFPVEFFLLENSVLGKDQRWEILIREIKPDGKSWYRLVNEGWNNAHMSLLSLTRGSTVGSSRN